MASFAEAHAYSIVCIPVNPTPDYSMVLASKAGVERLQNRPGIAITAPVNDWQWQTPMLSGDIKPIAQTRRNGALKRDLAHACSYSLPLLMISRNVPCNQCLHRGHASTRHIWTARHCGGYI